MVARAMPGWQGLIFHPRACHGPGLWMGTRCACVFYTGTLVDYLAKEAMEELRNLGFCVPYTGGIRPYSPPYMAVYLQVYGCLQGASTGTKTPQTNTAMPMRLVQTNNATVDRMFWWSKVRLIVLGVVGTCFIFFLRILPCVYSVWCHRH